MDSSKHGDSCVNMLTYSDERKFSARYFCHFVGRQDFEFKIGADRKEVGGIFRFALRAPSPLQNCRAERRGFAGCVCCVLRFAFSPTIACALGLFIREVNNHVFRASSRCEASVGYARRPTFYAPNVVSLGRIDFSG